MFEFSEAPNADHSKIISCIWNVHTLKKHSSVYNGFGARCAHTDIYLFLFPLYVFISLGLLTEWMLSVESVCAFHNIVYFNQNVWLFWFVSMYKFVTFSLQIWNHAIAWIWLCALVLNASVIGNSVPPMIIVLYWKL